MKQLLDEEESPHEMKRFPASHKFEYLPAYHSGSSSICEREQY